ncbi:MAG TPA: ECF-type sigma factor [Pirellulaceae bacterium]
MLKLVEFVSSDHGCSMSEKRSSPNDRERKEVPSRQAAPLPPAPKSVSDARLEELMPLVYQQLRAVAEERLRAERPGHTLQATALVHEAFCRLAGERRIPWDGPGHFYVAAAEAMRRVLLDHAKARGRQKRGGGRKRIPLNVVDLATMDDPEEVMALEEAVRRLEKENAEAAAVVRLRFYAGLSVDETAKTLELSPRTVDRRWEFARAWLYRSLNRTDEPSGSENRSGDTDDVT